MGLIEEIIDTPSVEPNAVIDEPFSAPKTGVTVEGRYLPTLYQKHAVKVRLQFAELVVGA